MNRTRRLRLLRTPRIAAGKERRAPRAATRVSFTRDDAATSLGRRRLGFVRDDRTGQRCVRFDAIALTDDRIAQRGAVFDAGALPEDACVDPRARTDCDVFPDNRRTGDGRARLHAYARADPNRSLYMCVRRDRCARIDLRSRRAWNRYVTEYDVPAGATILCRRPDIAPICTACVVSVERRSIALQFGKYLLSEIVKRPGGNSFENLGRKHVDSRVCQPAALGAFGRFLLEADDFSAIVEHDDPVLIDLFTFDQSNRSGRIAFVMECYETIEREVRQIVAPDEAARHD